MVDKNYKILGKMTKIFVQNWTLRLDKMLIGTRKGTILVAYINRGK